MQPTRFPILFVTGSDTGAGKTVLAAALTRWWRRAGVPAIALKPLCSGGRDDARALAAASDHALPLDTVNPWAFRAPLAPLLAARRAGRSVRLAEVTDHLRTVARHVGPVIVEGAGGLLSPLGEDFDNLALLRALRARPIIAVPDRLGAVNQARLVLAALPTALRRRAILVLIAQSPPDPAARTNAALLRESEPGCLILRFPRFPTGRLPPAATRTLAALAAACASELTSRRGRGFRGSPPAKPSPSR